MRKLNFTIEDQEQSTWCWAAVAVGVSKYYSRSSTWTQCLVADALFKEKNCCKNSSECDEPKPLEQALTCTRNLHDKSAEESFEKVRNEIDAGRPVAARLGYPGRGGHFVVIYGYKIVKNKDYSETHYFWICDSLYIIQSLMKVSVFRNQYNNGGVGKWTNTYFTKEKGE